MASRLLIAALGTPTPIVCDEIATVNALRRAR
jgi:hypothetical protein